MKVFANCRTVRVLGSLFVLIPCSVSAQIVQGQVVELVAGTPVDSGLVVLLDEAGTEVARTRTNADGIFQLRAPRVGKYSIRADGEGYSVSEFPPFELGLEVPLSFRLLIPSENAAANVSQTTAFEDETRIDQICQGEDVPGLPVVVGVVRDAITHEPIAQASVIMTWSPVPRELATLVRNLEDSQGAVATGTTGFYSVCGAPQGSRIDVYAGYQGQTSEFVSLRFDAGGVYVGERFVSMNSRLFRHDLEILPREQRNASIAGTVTDTAGTGVANAQVRIVGADYTTRANIFGQFRLTGLPPGSMRIGVEMVGYTPTRAPIELNAGEALELPAGALQMRPLATELAPIVVEADAPTVRRDLSEFERRRARGSGSFVTRAQFTEIGEPGKTTDVLRRMRGVSVRPGTSARLPWIITSTRDVRASNQYAGGVCFPLVFVDERHVGTTGDFVVDNFLSVDQIEAIEFYSSIAGVPPEFNRPGAVCGVVVFWTR